MQNALEAYAPNSAVANDVLNVLNYGIEKCPDLQAKLVN